MVVRHPRDEESFRGTLRATRRFGLTTHASFRYFLGYPSQPMSTMGTVFSLVRTFTTYLYRGSFATNSHLAAKLSTIRGGRSGVNRLPELWSNLERPMIERKL